MSLILTRHRALFEIKEIKRIFFLLVSFIILFIIHYDIAGLYLKILRTVFVQKKIYILRSEKVILKCQNFLNVFWHNLESLINFSFRRIIWRSRQKVSQYMTFTQELQRGRKRVKGKLRCFFHLAVTLP